MFSISVSKTYTEHTYKIFPSLVKIQILRSLAILREGQGLSRVFESTQQPPLCSVTVPGIAKSLSH